MTKKLKVQSNVKHDECQTPKEGISPLLPFLDKKQTIWDSAYGGGVFG